MHCLVFHALIAITNPCGGLFYLSKIMIANKYNKQYTLYMMLMHIKILLLSRLHISYHVIDIYYLHSQKLIIIFVLCCCSCVTMGISISFWSRLFHHHWCTDMTVCTKVNAVVGHVAQISMIPFTCKSRVLYKSWYRSVPKKHPSYFILHPVVCGYGSIIWRQNAFLTLERDCTF